LHAPASCALEPAPLTAVLQNALIKGFSARPSQQPGSIGATSPHRRRPDDETHFSTLEDQACAYARLSRPHEDRGRSQGAVGPTRQGPRAVDARLGVPIAAPTPSGGAAGGRAPRRRAGALSGPAAFEALFQRGARREGRFVQLVFSPATDPGGGRHGFVVGRKVVKRAVDRNRFKRLVRERLRRFEPPWPYDVVIRMKRPVERGGVDPAAMEAVALLERLLGPTSP
jgi:ribonuclease P protein component